MSKRELINLISAIQKGLKELDESEYEQLLEGKGQIKFIGLESTVVGKSKRTKQKNRVTLTEEELRDLVDVLKVCRTRDDACEILRKGNRILSKDSLNRLARLLGVYVSKSDRRESIEEKIVESVVGTRLRSEAIRGLSLKGTTQIELGGQFHAR